jgi:hypothetical protein
MKLHPFVLESPLSPEECVRRLRSTIAEKGMGFFTIGDFGEETEFYGKIEDNRIEVRKRRLWFWRNDFAPHLFATLVPSSAGTRIDGYFGIGSRVSGFMTLWLALLGIGGAVSFVTCLNQISHGHRFARNGDAMVGVIVPPALFIFGLLLPRLGYYVSFWHQGELLDFAKRTSTPKKLF